MRRRFNGYDAFVYGFTLLFALFCVLPMLLVVIVSFTDEMIVARNGYAFWPEKWSVDAYKLVFRSVDVMLRSYGVTILVTVVGTLCAVLMTAGAGYALSNPGARLRNALSLYFYFTMLFSGGVVPWYIICRQLGLVNNVGALMVPSLMFNPFNMFLTRNYMAGLPPSLRESATIDGAGELRIAAQIIIPLSKPVLAAIALFYAIGYWNDWWNAIMLVENSKLFTLQYMLFKLQSEISMLSQMQHVSSANASQLPSETLKMATAFATAAPILFLYPLLQKHFVQGLVMGAVKG